MATHSSNLVWRIHGQRILAGYSPWGCKESGMTEWLHYYFTIPSLWSEVNFLQNLCNITLLKLHFRNSQIRWEWIISRSNIKGWNQNEKGIELCYWVLMQVANLKLYFSSKLLFLILLLLFIEEGFPCSSVGKESACSAGNPGSIPGLGRSLKKEMATCFSTLAWKIP